MVTPRWIGLTCLVIVAFSGAAQADDGRVAFETGRRLYLEGDYQGALPHLMAAYESSGHRPSTILALGKCRRALGDDEGARLLYRDYLAVQPPPPDAPKVQLELDELEAKLRAEREEPGEVDFLDQQRRPTPGAPPEWEADLTAPPPPDPGVLERPLFWIGAGVLLVAVGALAIGLAASSADPGPLGGTLGGVLTR